MLSFNMHNGLLITILICGIAFPQNAPIDFESGGFGANWTWTVFENDSNPALEIVANPSISGINTSATVAKFTALQSGQPWAGCESQHGTDIGTFSLDATNSTVKIMVYKTVISDVGIKFVIPSSGSLGEIKVSNTVINEWEELTYDFSSHIGFPEAIGIDQIVVFPDFDLDGRTQDNIVYFDNISFSADSVGGSTGEPDVAAPSPAIDASNVISLFSNAYTDVTVDTWSASWDQADVADVQIAGNDTKLYINLNYAGIEFTSQTIDATAMSHFHMDIWTPDATDGGEVFKIKLVDFGADGAWSGGDDVEHELTFSNTTSPALATEEWVSIDVPLADFTGLTTTDHLAQLIISGDPNTVYVDNVYFYSTSAGVNEAPGVQPNAFELKQNYPNPFNPATTITFNLKKAQMVSLDLLNVNGQHVASLYEGYTKSGEHSIQFNAEQLAAGIYFYSLSIEGHSTVKKMVLIK